MGSGERRVFGQRNGVGVPPPRRCTFNSDEQLSPDHNHGEIVLDRDTIDASA
jgi:hypothetical protein